VLLTTDARESLREYSKPEPYFGTPQEALFQGIRKLPDVEMHVVSCWQKPMTAPAKLADNIWFHGLVVPKIGWLRTGYQGCIRAIRKKLREIQPDVVHGQGTERDCAICAALSGHPNILTIHGNMGAISTLLNARPFSFLWLAARLERWTIPRNNGVLCITNYTREQVRSLARRTWVLPNPVDADFFSIKNNPAKLPQILVVGHIQERKNQIRLLQALDPIAKQIPLQALFYGKAPHGDPYAVKFLEMAHQRSWCRHGFADRKTLRAALESATMLVLPSLEDNCPMSVLEAMAAGVPVVAAKVGGVPELFEDGISGLFCDPLEPESIRGAIQRVLTEPGLASQLATHGRKRALACFHPEVIAREHLRIYRELLSTNG
jgi:glycosyltransferase involved in cell wall biosynthesis